MTDESSKAVTILLYASNRLTRENVRLALGRKVASDLPPVSVVEVATQPAVVTAMDEGGIDLAILDGEAVPGGMGLCRQLKDEIVRCPPILVLTGRPDDAWLATWSRADGVAPHPIDPFRLPGSWPTCSAPGSPDPPGAAFAPGPHSPRSVDVSPSTQDRKRRSSGAGILGDRPADPARCVGIFGTDGAVRWRPTRGSGDENPSTWWPAPLG